MTGQTAASRAQADIAKMEQDLGLTGASALTKAGAERQKYQQSILDYPMLQAKNVSDLMRGYQVPISSTQQFKGPRPGSYQQSPLATATGLIGVLGSGAAGTAGTRLQELWGKIIGGTATPSEAAELFNNSYQIEDLDPGRTGTVTGGGGDDTVTGGGG